MSDVLRPEDLAKIASDAEAAELQKALLLKHAVDDEQKALRDAFMHRELRLEAKANYCNDAGWRINNLEADWPVSLEGFAKVAYEFYLAELQPLGDRLSTRILNYPGMPGDVGLYLNW